MIHTPHKTAARVLLVLASVWSLQGCAQMSSQSRPVDMGRPPKIEAPSPISPDAPAKEEPAVSVEPEAFLPDSAAPVSVKLEAPARVEAPVPSKSVARVDPVPATKEPTPYVHVVRWKGETLSIIAQWYTASWQNWEVLARANPGIDPNRIAIGDRIQVPERLLKKRDPLPFDLPLPSPGWTQPKKTGGEPRTGTEDVVLFGPAEATTKHEPAPEGIKLFEPTEIAGKPAEAPEESGLFGPLE